jgi:hypothetical protein
MSDPRFDDSELPAKPDRTLKDRSDRFGLVVSIRRLRGRRRFGGPLHANERATETHARAIRREQSDQPSDGPPASQK